MGEVDGIRDGMTYRQVERALRRMGFRVLRHSGDHAIFGLGPRRVAVRQGRPTEGGPRHTIRQMALQARGEQPWGWGGVSLWFCQASGSRPPDMLTPAPGTEPLRSPVSRGVSPPGTASRPA